MSVIGKYPGVYPEITDLSQITENASTSILAAVGEARKGSVFKRKYITSTAALESTFGTPDLKYGYMCHCMTCALADAGESYVVRVCSEDSKYAAVKIPSENAEKVPAFKEGFTLPEVDNCEDESFFYKYKMDSEGYYVLDEAGERILETDEHGNPIVDTDTIMTIIGENPNMDDIRVRFEETTVLPASTKATSIELETETTEEAKISYAIVNTGSTEHNLSVGDKVVVSGSQVPAFNGTFTVDKVRDDNTKAYKVLSLETGAYRYVEEAPNGYMTKVFNDLNSRTLYTSEPNAYYVNRFFALEDIEQREKPFYYVSTSVDGEVLSKYYTPVMSTNPAEPRTFFVPRDSEDVKWEEATVVGNKAYTYPGAEDLGEEGIDIISMSQFSPLTTEGKPYRFMLNHVPYCTKTDMVKDEEGRWVSATDGIVATSEYDVNTELSTGGEYTGPVFFVYSATRKCLKEGSVVYQDPEKTEVARIIGLTNEYGEAFDAAFRCNVNNSFDIVSEQYVKSGSDLYASSELLHKVATAGVGNFVYMSSEPIVNTIYSFRYKLDSNPESAPASLRWVKNPSNDERKFDVSVYEVIDGVFNVVETFNDCTLYPSIDGYGVQMKIDSKINENSNYIKVVLNSTVLDQELIDTPFPMMVSVTNGKLVGGDTDMAASNMDIIKGWDMFSERDDVTVNILMQAGYGAVDEHSIEQKMLEVANKRRDCFCIFDVPITEVASGVNQRVEDYRKNNLGIDSYRAALYSPWVKVFDSYTGTKNVMLPPSGFVCGVIARTDTNRGVWVAPAGMNNGAIACPTLTPTGLTYEYTTEEQGSVYSNNINYIRKTSGMYLIWGQKTLQFKKSALDRINVIRMIIYIETSLREAAKWHLFEQNTAYKRAQIVMQFESWLDPIRVAGGIFEYKVVCDETNNTPEVIMNNQMYIDVYIKPEYAAEFIKLNTIVQRRDATIGIS